MSPEGLKQAIINEIRQASKRNERILDNLSVELIKKWLSENQPHIIRNNRVLDIERAIISVLSR